MVGQGGDAFSAQPRGSLVDLLARLAVDDARFALVLVAQKGEQPPARVAVLLDDGVANVRPVEAGDEQAGAFQLQADDDVGAGVLVRGGGERHARHIRVALVQHAQAQVVGAEVMPPLADALRLVDGKEAEQPARMQRVELREKAGRGDALGRRVHQRQARARHLGLGPAGLAGVQRRVEERRAHAGFLERADLVVHQRDQGAHHHRDAVSGTLARDRRHLVAQALAAAGGHQHDRAAARRDVPDHLRLQAAERRVAEDFLQDGERRAGGSAHARRRFASGFSRAGKGSAVWYFTCLRAKLERMLPTPGTRARKSTMKRSSACMSGTTTRIR